MKRILKILFPLLILGALAYQFRLPLRGGLMPLWYMVESYIFPQVPCAEPIMYTLGDFDTRFNISREYFLNALLDAEKMWEKPLGKELFEYEEDSENVDSLKINLVYDYRQQATNKLESLGITMKDNQASYDSLKIKFTELKAELEVEGVDYNARVQDFNQKQKVYEGQVEYWNARGGAPKKEYEQLQVEKSVLERESSQLQTLHNKMGEMVEEINALVVALNRLVGTLNLSVEKYNTVGASRGESFTEGVYYSDGSSKGIDIFEFRNRSNLIWVLTHELGHALDLEHVDDPKAIMYELNQGTSVNLTKTDLDALKAKCGISE
ncbi:MAG: matrixin family metalloprotease [Candidatus Paceibacterota bacterium]|jgi:hypothetical protein